MENPASAIPASSSIWGSLNSWFTSTVFFILLNLMIATIFFTSNLPNQQQQNNQEQQDQEDKQQKQNSDNHPQIARSPSILHRLKSFNFLPQQQLQTQDDDDDNQLEREPLHVAATHYVFNQPLHYQHFDFDSDHTHQVERVDNEFQFDPTRYEMGKVEDGENFDSEPTRKENGIDGFDSSFDFNPTRKENEYERFDFDPTHEDEQVDQLQNLDEVYSKLKGGGHHDRTKSESEIRPKPTTKFKKSASLKVGFSHLNEEKTVEARRPATAAKVVHDDDEEVDSKVDDFINKFKNDLILLWS